MPVEKKTVKKAKSESMLGYLRTFNDKLEQIPNTVQKTFERAYAVEDELPQKGMDMICEWSAWRVNTIIEAARQQAVKALHDQNSFVNKVMKPVNAVYSIVTNPLGALGAIASAVKSIAGIFITPIANLVNFTIELVTELARTAELLAKLSALVPPAPPSPNLNTNKFKIQIKPLTVGTITEDPSNLPSPEEMFPEPIVPFSLKYFQILADEAKLIYRRKETFYTSDEYSKLPTEPDPENPVGSEDDGKFPVGDTRTRDSKLPTEPDPIPVGSESDNLNKEDLRTQDEKNVDIALENASKKAKNAVAVSKKEQKEAEKARRKEN